MVTLDASALVALLAARDAYHDRMRRLLLTERPPYLIPEPVLAELAYLIETRAGAHVMDHILADAEVVAWVLAPPAPYLGRIRQLASPHADLPLGVLDASEAAVAEEHGGRLLSPNGPFQVVAAEGRIEVVA